MLFRSRYRGIEHADSFIVDPHKWLFAPFDCCALLYRDPLQARRAHTQHAEYLDVLQHDDEWNPSDFAHHLSRRARGLPFWFSLATYGTAAVIPVALRMSARRFGHTATLLDSGEALELLDVEEREVDVGRGLVVVREEGRVPVGEEASLLLAVELLEALARPAVRACVPTAGTAGTATES